MHNSIPLSCSYYVKNRLNFYFINKNIRYLVFSLSAKITYIHKWPLQPFSQNYGLALHTHIVCVNFIREWRDLQFNIQSERQIFEILCHGIVIYSQSFSQKSAEKNRQRNIFFSYFVLMADLVSEPGLYV